MDRSEYRDPWTFQNIGILGLLINIGISGPLKILESINCSECRDPRTAQNIGINGPLRIQGSMDRSEIQGSTDCSEYRDPWTVQNIEILGPLRIKGIHEPLRMKESMDRSKYRDPRTVQKYSDPRNDQKRELQESINNCKRTIWTRNQKMKIIFPDVIPFFEKSTKKVSGESNYFQMFLGYNLPVRILPSGNVFSSSFYVLPILNIGKMQNNFPLLDM